MAEIEMFGHMGDGTPVRRAALSNGKLAVGILDRGAILQDMRVAGRSDPVCLGATEPGAYERSMTHFGAVMGPVANRISGATAEIAGNHYTFDANENGQTTLHSGSSGIHQMPWEIVDVGPAHVTLAIELRDGLGGFPGNRRITATYRLNEDTLVLDLSATTDAPTLMNLAHHGYWSVGPGESWRGQTLQILAEHYLPTDELTIPTGEIAPVADTPFDFRLPRVLGPDLPPIDHNYCLSDAPREMSPALRLSNSDGWTLEISTTSPGLQIFDMHTFGTGGEPTIHGRPYPSHAALAVEPQFWPDAPGRPRWPGILLQPGDTYHQTSRYRVWRA